MLNSRFFQPILAQNNGIGPAESPPVKPRLPSARAIALMSADFWAGYLSGAAGIVIGNPLDLIKVRVQASTTSPDLASSAKPRIQSFKEGLRGLPAPVLTYGALNALLFTSYNRSLLLLSRSTLANRDGQHGLDLFPTSATPAGTYPYWAHFTAGALAGLATFVISAPTELIKCRVQVLEAESPPSNIHNHPGPAQTRGQASLTSSWHVVKTTFQAQGLRGFYHGGVITSLRDSLGYGAYFWTYEVSKAAWDVYLRAPRSGSDPGDQASAQANPSNSQEAAKILMCGGLAGIATWVSIFPLDVIKTRVQTMQMPAVVSSSASPERTTLLSHQRAHHQETLPKAPGAWKVAKEAYRREGAQVFFRGMTVCCVRAFIVNAVQWAVYEWMMRYLMAA